MSAIRKLIEGVRGPTATDLTPATADAAEKELNDLERINGNLKAELEAANECLASRWTLICRFQDQLEERERADAELLSAWREHGDWEPVHFEQAFKRWVAARGGR